MSTIKKQTISTPYITKKTLKKIKNENKKIIASMSCSDLIDIGQNQIEAWAPKKPISTPFLQNVTQNLYTNGF